MKFTVFFLFYKFRDFTAFSFHIRIPIIFEGVLAHTAACHLKENDHVYIDGHLSADPPSNVTRNQASVQV